MSTTSNIEIRLIQKSQLETIIPLLILLNDSVEEKLLKERVAAMATENYECVGIYDGDELIGICGLWFQTRHYSGKSMEPDHVIIKDEFQGKGLGNKLFDWLDDYAKANNIEAIELNTYVENKRSHKFYYNLGFEILGFHFLKRMD